MPRRGPELPLRGIGAHCPSGRWKDGSRGPRGPGHPEKDERKSQDLKPELPRNALPRVWLRCRGPFGGPAWRIPSTGFSG